MRLALPILVGFIGLLSLSGCIESRADSAGTVEISPKALEVAESEFAADGTFRASCEVVNKTRNTVRILGAEASCVCTNVRLPDDSDIPPNGAARIELLITRPGRRDRAASAKILTSDKSFPVLILPIIARGPVPAIPRLQWHPHELQAVCDSGGEISSTSTELTVLEKRGTPPLLRQHSSLNHGVRLVIELRSETHHADPQIVCRSYQVCVSGRIDASILPRRMLLDFPETFAQIFAGQALTLHVKRNNSFEVFPKSITLAVGDRERKVSVAVIGGSKFGWSLDRSVSRVQGCEVEFIPVSPNSTPNRAQLATLIVRRSDSSLALTPFEFAVPIKADPMGDAIAAPTILVE